MTDVKELVPLPGTIEERIINAEPVDAKKLRKGVGLALMIGGPAEMYLSTVHLLKEYAIVYARSITYALSNVAGDGVAKMKAAKQMGNEITMMDTYLWYPLELLAGAAVVYAGAKLFLDRDFIRDTKDKLKGKRAS